MPAGRSDHHTLRMLWGTEAGVFSLLPSLAVPPWSRPHTDTHFHEAGVLGWGAVIWNIHNLRHQQRATVHWHWEREYTKCTHIHMDSIIQKYPYALSTPTLLHKRWDVLTKSEHKWSQKTHLKWMSLKTHLNTRWKHGLFAEDSPSPLKFVDVPLSPDSSPAWVSNTVAYG